MPVQPCMKWIPIKKKDGAIQEKVIGWRILRAGKELSLVISNEDMNDIIRIIKSLENSGLSVDGINGTVKHKVKKQMVDFLLYD